MARVEVDVERHQRAGGNRNKIVCKGLPPGRSARIEKYARETKSGKCFDVQVVGYFAYLHRVGR